MKEKAEIFVYNHLSLHPQLTPVSHSEMDVKSVNTEGSFLSGWGRRRNKTVALQTLCALLWVFPHDQHKLWILNAVFLKMQNQKIWAWSQPLDLETSVIWGRLNQYLNTVAQTSSWNITADLHLPSVCPLLRWLRLLCLLWPEQAIQNMIAPEGWEMTKNSRSFLV